MFSNLEIGFSIKKPVYTDSLKKGKTNLQKNANIDLMDGLEASANVNRVGIMKTKMEIGLNSVELERRVQKDYLSKIRLLGLDSKEYEVLENGDKEALCHLVKVAKILNDVYLKQDNPKNIEFKNYLGEEIRKGNSDAEKALILFNAQNGVSAIDRQTQMVNLLKGDSPKEGKGLYPQDINEKELHSILIKMIEEGEIEEVRDILSQRTVVVRNGEKLKAIDYTDAYAKEFNLAAEELEKAANVSTNKDFNEYLILQAKALRKNDKMLDAYADKKWAELQDTPLEFTISRENYEDELTGTVFENEKLAKLLKENNIVPIPKDFIGVRVGIVNKEGTEFLQKFKEFLPILAKKMPYSDEYEQTVTAGEDVKQTMVDVDLVAITGDSGAYRGGITIAQNLPNSDKPSLEIGGGRRNVYHRQVRLSANPEKLQKRLDVLLDKTQHSKYSLEADHWFTIGHENAHSLGPAEKSSLGKYKSIIEENKADMASLFFVDTLVEEGFYTKDQRDKILVSACTDLFSKSKPTMSQAHRVRSVMQANYLIENGAIEITEEDKIKINTDKVVFVAKKMLDEIIRLQIDGNVDLAKAYIDKYFVWTPIMEKIGQKLTEIDKTLNGRVVSELADKISE